MTRLRDPAGAIRGQSAGLSIAKLQASHPGRTRARFPVARYTVPAATRPGRHPRRFYCCEEVRIVRLHPAILPSEARASWHRPASSWVRRTLPRPRATGRSRPRSGLPRTWVNSGPGESSLAFGGSTAHWVRLIEPARLTLLRLCTCLGSCLGDRRRTTHPAAVQEIGPAILCRLWIGHTSGPMLAAEPVEASCNRGADGRSRDTIRAEPLPAAVVRPVNLRS